MTTIITKRCDKCGKTASDQYQFTQMILIIRLRKRVEYDLCRECTSIVQNSIPKIPTP